MFTRNWYKMTASTITRTVQTLVNLSGVETTNDNSYSANTQMIGLRSDLPYIPSMWYLRTALNNNGGVFLGTGSSAPTMDDHALSGDIITGYQYNSGVEILNDNSGTTITAVYTITNGNSTDITIAEIGLITSLNSGTAVVNKCLLERTVLDEPVTIPAGGVGQVTYTIRMNYPTA